MTLPIFALERVDEGRDSSYRRLHDQVFVRQPEGLRKNDREIIESSQFSRAPASAGGTKRENRKRKGPHQVRRRCCEHSASRVEGDRSDGLFGVALRLDERVAVVPCRTTVRHLHLALVGNLDHVPGNDVTVSTAWIEQRRKGSDLKTLSAARSQAAELTAEYVLPVWAPADLLTTACPLRRRQPSVLVSTSQPLETLQPSEDVTLERVEHVVDVVGRSYEDEAAVGGKTEGGDDRYARSVR